MNKSEVPPFAQLEKLQFVELIAYFHGSVIRDDLIHRFGISKASATNVLAMYGQIAPGNLNYNIRLKRYEVSQDFKPVFNIRMLIDRIPVYTMPKLHSPADEDAIERIALISRAIQRTQSLMITYTSASSGTSTRQIVPVAFANNLLRWHLRAYDRKRGKHVDFVFKRIREVRLLENDVIEPHEHPNCDAEWHSLIELKIKAHPYNLTDAQSFDMGNETQTVKIRAAMAGYFLSLWNVDCSQDASLRGKEYQYVLANIMEISEVADLGLAPGQSRKI